MKHIFLGAALMASAGLAQADYKDVIGFTMTGECDFAEYMKLVDDFNVWAKPRGYSAEVLVPQYQSDLATYYWVGTSPDTATFGAAHDEWMKGVMTEGSAPAKLAERFEKCSLNHTRNAYLAY